MSRKRLVLPTKASYNFKKTRTHGHGTCGVTLVAEIPRIGLPVGMASDQPHVWIEYDCRFSYRICMLACKNKLQWVM